MNREETFMEELAPYIEKCHVVIGSTAFDIDNCKARIKLLHRSPYQTETAQLVNLETAKVTKIAPFLEKFIALYEKTGCSLTASPLILDSDKKDQRWVITAEERTINVRYFTGLTVNSNHEAEALQILGFKQAESGWKKTF